MRSTIPTALAVLLLAACGATETTSTLTGNPTTGTPPAAKSRPANPDVGDLVDLSFTARTLDGGAFSGEDLAGRPAVLWFWAPWCPTCRAQAPNVSALGQQYRGRVSVIGVGGLATREMIEDLAPQIRNITHLVDVESTVWNHFGVEAQSTYALIDADGRLVSEGYLDDDELNRLVADLAGQGS